ncbi:Serine/threonine protein kinase [Desulfofustis glycolicus DSM 9705]|uniref:Serine/threonine protein kinase n=2 Tax=Desulfofustis glycolicus TaxID=51195 RepID=A0A1M5XJP8_9BACT|nr:Serine/threonine protein kinase [Desulfofustis glycolicus DSM 9705]
MSEVHRAKNLLDGGIVALKLLLPRDEIFIDLVGEKKLRDIFFAEARTMAGLQHECIAGIIESGEIDDILYIALEYVPRSLGSIIGDSTRIEVTRILGTSLTCDYLRQTLCCLDAVHGAGLVHRDIKPDNLMITERDQVKLIDFGLCKTAGNEEMVIPGMQIGSPFYTAPEQEHDPAAADERADLFSAGVIAYRLLTGRLINHRQGKIAAASRFNADLTKQWDQFLFKGVHKERSKRFQSARAMRLHLEDICRSV